MKFKKLKGMAMLALAVSMVMTAGAVPAFAQTANLTDIDGHWAQSAIESLVDKGAVSGYEDNTFKPDKEITRAEFVTIINKFCGFTDDDAEQFEDVSENAWYAKQLLIAKKAGYFSGTGNNMSGAESNITREDAFAIIARIYKYTGSADTTFTDASEISNYAKDAVAALSEAGIIAGYSDNSIKPKNFITRAETASIIVKGEMEKKSTAELTSLEIKDITAKEIFDSTKFDAEKTSYSINVQSDIYGVLINPIASEGATIKVTAGNNTYKADTWGNITEDYVAGTEIKYENVEGDGGYKGYIIPLDQNKTSYDSEYVQPVEITVTKDGESKTYTVTITRETLKDIYAKFKELKYTAKNGETIPYEIYVPSDYKEGEQLPIVFALHGSGQREQDTDMVLKRYQMATIWAKDSEAGIRRCIVLAPQCNTAEGGRNWTNMMLEDESKKDAFTADPKLVAAYELLEKTIADYNVDKSRVYMTGLSAGGYATYLLAIEHPETFAAIIPVAGGVDTSATDKIAKLKGIGIWTIQATNDPLVSYETVYKPTMEALKDLDVKTTLYANSEVFYPSGHFSWTPAYADEEMRQWLFTQKK